MAILKLSAAARSAMGQALISTFDAAAGPCTLKFYDGAMPASVATAVTTQVLLGTLTCNDPVASEATGIVTFNTITQDDAADASGTVTWARLFDGAGVAQMDMDVSNAAGAGVIKMNTVTIVAGGPIKVTSFTITMGG